jgi:hypothetical protein
MIIDNNIVLSGMKHRLLGFFQNLGVRIAGPTQPPISALNYAKGNLHLLLLVVKPFSGIISCAQPVLYTGCIFGYNICKLKEPGSALRPG